MIRDRPAWDEPSWGVAAGACGVDKAQALSHHAVLLAMIVVALSFIVDMLCRHLLPNTLSSIIEMPTLQAAQTILQESALSFLGLGTGSTYPTWGQMISLGRGLAVAWWLPAVPGLAILLTVLAINLVGDRLRDALDPRVT